MKIQKKPQYNYDADGITEENGYTKWYHWEKVRMPARVIGIALVALIFVASRVFKEELAAYGKMNQVIIALSALATLIIVVVPLHEILHLLVMSKGKLDDRCVITAGGGAVSALFNGHLSRSRQIVCFIVPCAVFAVIFSAAAAFSGGLLRLYFIYLLIMSCISSYTDIFMVFYTLKHVGKNETIYGIYKKEM